MIVAQALLVIAIIMISVRFLSSPNSIQTKAWKKILLMLFSAAAVIVIFIPQLMNDIANAFGIGRGADLLLYVLVLSFIFEQVNRYIKQKEDQKRMVVLARKVALLEAEITKSSN